MIVIKTRSLARALRTSGQLLSKPFATATALALIAIAGPIAARAQTATAPDPHDESIVNLDNYVVSASRTPQDPRYTPSSVTLVQPGELALSQYTDLRTALAQVPGMSVSNSGPIGSPSSVFMRGSNSDHTLFVVDGIRMNDRAASYTNFLGGADLGGIGRMEVLRGPQSTLYGSSAMGGVIAIDTLRGCGATTGSIEATTGAFDTWSLAAAVSGGTRILGYSTSLNRFSTANDLPENDFAHWGYTARLEYAPTDTFLLGGSFRGDNDDYQQTGSTQYPAPGAAATDNYLGTLYAQVRIANTFTSRLTAGYHERHYDWNPVIITGWETSASQYNKRQVLDWQNTWKPIQQLEAVAGLNYEHSNFVNNGDPMKDNIAAGYLSAIARPVKTVTLTAGIRYDDFDSVGSATTWRAAAAWLPVNGTKFHASHGTGFNAPSPSDIAGVPSWGTLPNYDLAPEKSRGWDLGVEQNLFNERATFGVTYFENRFRDLIAWVPLSAYTSTYDNIAHARTRGAEVSALVRITSTLQVRASYTYLDAKDTDSGNRLARRPRHTTDAEIRFQATRDILIGAGVHGVSDRIDSVKMEDYTCARVFASYTLRPANLTFKLRAENALDEKYDDVPGYAALPFGLFGGVEWKF